MRACTGVEGNGGESEGEGGDGGKTQPPDACAPSVWTQVWASVSTLGEHGPERRRATHTDHRQGLLALQQHGRRPLPLPPRGLGRREARRVRPREDGEVRLCVRAGRGAPMHARVYGSGGRGGVKGGAGLGRMRCEHGAEMKEMQMGASRTSPSSSAHGGDADGRSRPGDVLSAALSTAWLDNARIRRSNLYMEGGGDMSGTRPLRSAPIPHTLRGRKPCAGLPIARALVEDGLAHDDILPPPRSAKIARRRRRRRRRPLPLRTRVVPGRRMAAVHDRVPQRLEILRERDPEGGAIRGLHARERGEDLWIRRCL